jgi:ketosteroid isomerase-like protein
LIGSYGSFRPGVYEKKFQTQKQVRFVSFLVIDSLTGRRNFQMKALALIALFVTATLHGCQCQPKKGADVSEIQSFMSKYADELRQGDIAPIVDRYSRQGSYFLGNGAKRFRSYDSIRLSYQTKWRAPSAFDWVDLSYDFLADDAVMVTGQFVWHKNANDSALYSYTGILKKEDGKWRIKLEDESASKISVAPSTTK